MFSAIQTAVKETGRFETIRKAVLDSEFITTTRSNILSRFVTASHQAGKKVVESAPVMREQDLQIIARLLFKRNTKKDLENRCLIIWQWQCVSRISEVSAVNYDAIEFHEPSSAIRVQLCRPKTSHDQVS
jgi:hypothetical protein